LEAVGPVAGDPVDHVAAVAGAERRDAARRPSRVLLQRGGEALLQVLERLAAPVAVDRVGERLAVAGGAVEVDHHRRVAGAGVGLRVPAVVEVVAERALRPAVDQERHRVLLRGIEIDGLTT
jgi:hypothetical protein